MEGITKSGLEEVGKGTKEFMVFCVVGFGEECEAG